MSFCSSNSLLKLKYRRPSYSVECFSCFYCVVSLVLLQVGCLEQIVTKHTITRSIKNFCFFRFKISDYDPIKSARQNRSLYRLKISVYSKFLKKHMKNHRETNSMNSLEARRNQLSNIFSKSEK